MHITQALDRYVVQLRADGRSHHTIRQYQRHVRLLARWLADRGHSGDIAELDHGDLAEFLASPAATQRPDGTPKRATSLNALRSSLRSFFGYLHAAGATAANPARLVRRARCESPPPRALSDEERARLVASLETAGSRAAVRDRALFRLLLESGIRVGSAVALDVEDLDLDSRQVFLRRMKGDRPEVAYLPEALAEHLRGFVADRRSGPLFQSRLGRRLTTRHVQRRLGEWLRRAGVRPASPHSLRHSFAMDLLRRTGNVLLVKEALRHRSITSTLVYARLEGSELRRILA